MVHTFAPLGGTRFDVRMTGGWKGPKIPAKIDDSILTGGSRIGMLIVCRPDGAKRFIENWIAP
jgi:hypothetical protein